jgi:hypothetical protein
VDLLATYHYPLKTAYARLGLASADIVEKVRRRYLAYRAPK